MVPDFFNALVFFGVGLALLLALGQLVNPGRNIRSWLLVIIFSSIAVLLFQQMTVIVKEDIDLNREFHFLLMAEYLLGPSIYLLYLSLFDREYKFSWRTLLFFLPAFAALLLVITLEIHQHITGHILTWIYDFIVIGKIAYLFHIMGIALIVGYIFTILLRLEIMSVIKKKNPARNRLHLIAIAIILFFTMITIIAILGMVLQNGFFQRLSLGLVSLFLIYWFVVSQLYPSLFYPYPKKIKSVKNVDISDAEKNRIQLELTRLMENEKIFCDEDLSLKRLADMLSLQPHQLSSYLNRELSINFNEFINTYRVNEAVNMMKEDSTRSLLSIAFAVGFNSKSVFYNAFSKQIGMSPAKYRKTV